MTDEMKQRHGCLTAWLILMLITNSVAALIYLLGSQEIRQQLPNAPDWVFPVLVLLCVVNFISTIGLFKWKIWGFYGFAGTSAITFVINLAMGLGIIQALLGLLGVAILYGVLHIGKERKGWAQLE